MPLYEYACRACGHAFEKLIRPGGDTPACEACGSADLEKLLSDVTMSSEQSRAANLQEGRSRAGKTRRDLYVAQDEYHKSHEHEH